MEWKYRGKNMERFNELILWFKNFNMDTFVTILTALLIFLVFKLFSGVLAYVIITVFKLNKDKEKNKKNFRKNGIYIALNLFFSILGLYLALIYLKLPENINVIINKIFKIFGIIGIVLVGLFIIGLVFGDDDDDSSDSNSNSNILIRRFQ